MSDSSRFIAVYYRCKLQEVADPNPNLNHPL